MRSFQGVSVTGFLPGLRGYCAHAVLGAGVRTAEEQTSNRFDSRTGIVTLSDGRQIGLRVANAGESTFAVGADGTRYTLDE